MKDESNTPDLVQNVIDEMTRNSWSREERSKTLNDGFEAEVRPLWEPPAPIDADLYREVTLEVAHELRFIDAKRITFRSQFSPSTSIWWIRFFLKVFTSQSFPTILQCRDVRLRVCSNPRSGLFG